MSRKAHDPEPVVERPAEDGRPAYRCLPDPKEVEREARKRAQRADIEAKRRARLEERARRPNPFNPFPIKLAVAQAALERGETAQKAADLADLSKATITKLRAGGYAGMIPLGLVDRLKAAESSKLTLAAGLILDEIVDNPEKLREATLVQLATALDKVIDKRELIDGRPTSRTDVLINASDREIEEKLVALHASLRQRLAERGLIDAECTDAETTPAAPMTEAAGDSDGADGWA